MKIEADDLMNYHCPRWDELPEIELYIDQVIFVLQSNLSIFSKDKSVPIITSSMINNYVKQNVIDPPIKKKYNKLQLSHLFVVCILKRLMSISEIGESIEVMKKIISVKDGYNIFCTELENALKKAFNPSYEPKSYLPKIADREYATLKAMVTAFANCILVDRLILLRKKDTP